ncbi:Coatomer subunit zeta-2 [Orobanche gracilis]
MVWLVPRRSNSNPHPHLVLARPPTKNINCFVAKFSEVRGPNDSHSPAISLILSDGHIAQSSPSTMELCPSVKNILLLDSEGKRVVVKYYSDDWPTNNAKEAFEKAVFTKTHKTNARTEGGRRHLPPPWLRPAYRNAEIAMFENNIIVYKFVQDLHFYVTGGEDENELILATVLQGFFDAVGNVDKKEALGNLDLILLCIDEIIDGGIVLETDASSIASKVASISMDSGAPLSEQTISQALATAREHLTRSLLK